MLFSLQTDFGKLQLGSNETQSNGTATFTYNMPSSWEGPLYVSFAGSKSYAASYLTVSISSSTSSTSGPPYVSGQENSPDLRLVGIPPITGAVVVGLFLIVLGCVYGVMIFVLVRAIGMRGRVRVGQ